jgi:amino acid adenylation domain-containing protein
VSRLLQHYLFDQANARPDAIAVALGEAPLTYGRLETDSNQLARLLRNFGCYRGERICLFLPKGLDAIVSIISVLKADCAYVPIDLESPARRIEKIVRAAEPKVILVTSSATSLVDDLVALECIDPSVTIGSIDDTPVEGSRFRSQFSRAEVRAQSREPLEYANSPEDPAHLLFTSGSTGTPKGVVIKHSNVIPFIDWAVAYFGIDSSDRISGHPPLHFDLSTFDIFGTQAAGAELRLVPPSLNLMPHKLAKFIRDAELTQWFSVPSVMTYLAKFDAIEFDDFRSLKRVLWCGEVLPTPVLTHWMQRLPHVRFTNLYGPTEATIASSYFTVNGPLAQNREPIPIGTACPGEELLVLGDDLRPAPRGRAGDLYIAGVGLSPGYWRDEEKTRAAFIEDPRAPSGSARIYKTGDLARIGNDGLVYFLGRADTQIKSRGYRIELGEIESALSVLECLREYAVVAIHSDSFEGWAICCAYVPLAAEGTKAADLKEMLRTSLPSYMVPTRWLSLDELPKNANGKIDGRLIREYFEKAARAPAGVTTTRRRDAS